MLLLLFPLSVTGDSSFGTLRFDLHWHADEDTLPNFWGPLATARDVQHEPYKEGPDGLRIVQYFDKARMEQFGTNAPFTTGLLTGELKTGQVQVGDHAVEPRTPARVNVAGDPGGDGPTYADLAQLPERVPPTNPAEVLPNRYDGGRFTQYQRGEALPVALTTNFLGPAPAFTYLQDSSGRYGQYVFTLFADFIARLHDPIGPKQANLS